VPVEEKENGRAPGKANKPSAVVATPLCLMVELYGFLIRFDDTK
jgi:hypothetical protein